MEVIGAVASILQLIDATVVAAKYVHEVKGSTREREKLRDELNSLVTLLSEIKAKAEKAHRMNTSVPHTNALTRDGGPLTALEVSVGHLNKQLVAVSPQQPPAGSSRWKVAAMKRSLVWPMQKPKCLELLNDVERTKSLAILALQQDTM
jgi:hypothetical protein